MEKLANPPFVNLFRLQHDLQNGLVSLAHTLPGQNTDVANGVIHALGDDTVAAPELLVIAVHLVAQNAGIHGCSDLGCTGGLCTVADSTRQYCNRVYEGVCDLAEPSAVKIAYSRTCTDSCTYCTAVGGQMIYAQPVTVNTDDSATPIQSTGTPYEGVNENGCVPFVFSHLLSKVYFTFVSTSQPLAVTNVQVTTGHFATGTYTINDQQQQWSETTLASTPLIFGDADGEVTTAGTTSQKACLIIPGQQTWNISLKQGDETKTATLTDFVFEPNKAYNILVTLQGASQITFKVNTLEAWGAEKDVDLNF